MRVRTLFLAVSLACLVAAIGGLALENSDPAVVASARAGAGAPRDSSFTAVAGAPRHMAPSGVELRLLELANADRARHGLPALAFDPALLEIARARAADQAGRPSLTHVDEGGAFMFEHLLLKAGLDYALAGENLARLRGSTQSTAERAHEALMRSPTHRANILEPEFDRLAVGSAQDENGRVILVQIFRATR